MVPSALPRCSGRMVSASSTAPAAHSPPKPSPMMVRAANSCSKFCARPQMKVHTANQAMEICSVFTRPIRSASHPASHPPMAETSRAPVAMIPALPAVMPQVAIRAGMTKL
jgi:hypothetical protein